MVKKQADAREKTEELFDEQYRIIGRRIAFFRKLKEETQVQLAEKMGISANYLSQIECGKRKRYSLHILMLAAAALNVPLKDLCN